MLHRLLKKGAAQLIRNPGTNSHSKLIDVRHHFVRECIHRRDFTIVQVSSGFQHADILTKALVYEVFVFHSKFLTNLKYFFCLRLVS